MESSAPPIDLGLLMGVPVGVKDLFAVDGCRSRREAWTTSPTHRRWGSVKRLRRAGCVILGKTKTSVAFGAVGRTRSAAPRATYGRGRAGRRAARAAVRRSPWRPASAPLPSAATMADRCAFPPRSRRLRPGTTVGLKTDGVFRSRRPSTASGSSRSAGDAAFAFAASRRAADRAGSPRRRHLRRSPCLSPRRPRRRCRSASAGPGDGRRGRRDARRPGDGLCAEREGSARCSRRALASLGCAAGMRGRWTSCRASDRCRPRRRGGRLCKSA